MRPAFRRSSEWLVRTSLLVAAALCVIPLLLAALGYDTVAPLIALWSGSFGSWYALTSGTLVRATPLIFTGLSVAVAFRAGVFNIGAEGQLLVGAAAAAAIGVTFGASLHAAVLPIELACGALGGAAWAGIAAVLRARFRVLEVISTIMLNFVAVYSAGYLVRGPLQEPLHVYPQSPSLVNAARLPRIMPDSRLHVGLLIALVVAGTLWWWLRSTAGGFRLRAAGANPDAARVAGQIDVEGTTLRAFLVSGALAGLAGAIELTGVTFALYENISPGYGYTGIAVALLARLHPLGVIASAVLFGALESGGSAMQRDAAVPATVVSVAEAVIILLLVAVWKVRLRESASVRGPAEPPAIPEGAA